MMLDITAHEQGDLLDALHDAHDDLLYRLDNHKLDYDADDIPRIERKLDRWERLIGRLSEGENL